MPKIDPTKLTKEIKNKYSVVSNAFRLSGGKKEKVKDGKPKDLIITEVGDVKQEEFYPQVKIGRWGDDDNTNEVNLSVRLIDDEIGKETLATENDKIKWGKGNKTARFYEIEPNEDYPEGAFEFDIELAKKPKTNKIGFSLNTKGVDFFYQPVLTQQEIDEGASRPENVVGSYAVYASENKANYVGGKEYKVGKVGHIYRPKIYDASGASVWGILSIDKEAGKLTVEIPQEFLDKAVYPVVVDPTFGYDTVGGTDGTFGENSIRINEYVSPSSGTITKLTLYSRYTSSGDTAYFRPVVYSGENSLVTYGDEVGFSEYSKLWKDLGLTEASLIESSNYRIGIWIKNVLGLVYLYYDTGLTLYRDNETYSSTGSPPSTFSEDASGDFKLSIYATYTAGGGETEKNVADSGTGTDSVSVKVLIGLSDSGSGVDATPAVRNSLTQTDGGSGTDSVSLKQIKSILDSGSGTEVLSLVIRAIIADSGSGNEIVGILTNLAMSDSGNGADAIRVLANIALTDTGAGSEAVQALARIAVSDSGMGNEALSTLINLSVNDSGVANEAIAVLVNLAIQDAGSGSDIVSVIRNVLVQDAANGAELVNILMRIYAQDSGTGEDIAKILSAVLVDDSGIASEEVKVAGENKFIQDSGVGNEAVSLIARIAVNELATATESVGIVNRLFVADNGQGSDVLRVLARLAIADNATAVEAVNVAARVAVQENGTANEALAIIVSALIQEAGSAIESVKVSNPEKIISDSGMGNDKISVILKRISIADLGSADDVVELLKRVAVSDEAIGIDVASVVANIILSDSGIGTEKIRARWDEWLCSTYKPKANPYRRKASPYTPKTSPYKKCGQ